MESMTLLSAVDPCSGSALPLNTDAGLPGFGNPWHAQAFGTAMALARAGAFTWKTWVETFSAEIPPIPNARLRQRMKHATGNGWPHSIAWCKR
jgi:hypothetical protein